MPGGDDDGSTVKSSKRGRKRAGEKRLFLIYSYLKDALKEEAIRVGDGSDDEQWK